jgi:hypothetical protein
MDFLCRCLDIWASGRPRDTAALLPTQVAPKFVSNIRDGEIRMADLVDLAIPANAQAATEALGLKVERSVTSGARVRQIPREEAEIAIECLRDWGISARIVENAPRSERPSEPLLHPWPNNASAINR